MKKPTAECPTCGRTVAVHVPRGGDGTAYVTNWHKRTRNGAREDCRAEVDVKDVTFPMTQWPVCHMCGLRCSPTSAWIDCRTPDADREQVAVYYVRNLRGRICDLPGHTLDLIASQLPETTRNFFDRYHQMQKDLGEFVGTRHERREDGHHEDEH